ncbi:unnamed protein product, partial [Staurois parvus]
MALGRKGLTCEVIKGLTVCCFTVCSVSAFNCKHTALYGYAVLCRAMQSSVQELTGERTVLFTFALPTRRCKI